MKKFFDAIIEVLIAIMSLVINIAGGICTIGWLTSSGTYYGAVVIVGVIVVFAYSFMKTWAISEKILAKLGYKWTNAMFEEEA